MTGSERYVYGVLATVALELEAQFYIQLVFKAPLCNTLTISDQKNREW